MSGNKQAKVKKKSAKKADETEPKKIARRGGRIEEFLIGNVRCFAETQRVPIRPITLLVGANSTGKTTFLGGYRVVHKLTETPSLNELPEHMWEGSPDFPWMERDAPSFNVWPFSMGAFRHIVNREAMKSASSSFQLGARIPYRAISAEQDWGRDSIQDTRKEKDGKADLIYSFEEEGSIPVARKASVVFSDADNEEIDVVLGDRQFDGAYRLAIYDRRAGKNVDVDGPWRALYVRGIALALSRNRDAKMPNMENIHKDLDRLLYPGADNEAKWRHLEFSNPSVVHSFAPTQPRPERTYNPVWTEESIPMLLARLSRTNKKEWTALRKRLVAFGRKSELFSDFDVKGTLLVSDPFEIHVEVAGVTSNVIDVGYGVGQVYPILAKIMRASQQEMRATFLLQQPEFHLHPQAQAALASFLAKSARDDGHIFLVETHSDFIMDRVCMHVAEGDIDPDDVALLFFEQQKTAGAVKIHRIELNRNGEPIDTPKGYRGFFLRETERALGLRKG